MLERERQAAVRQHEDELAAEMQRLDDVAKEQRLNQMQVMERAYQNQLQVPFCFMLGLLLCALPAALRFACLPALQAT